ncbi:MAG TPA: DNA-directed RNA polymerase subunit delta [Negativicutes bacterium]|nr:DNA-directed RNA polymerase subunit delta [Negativicutes bacterium]
MEETDNTISGVDAAYRILKDRKTDLYFRDLLTEVLIARKVPSYLMKQAMAELHTQVNMDSRFTFKGKGFWGLTEWVPLPRTAGSKTEDASAAVLDETVEIRRTKLQGIQQPDEVETTFQNDNDEPAQNE